jgi:hypothetical protein
LLKGILFIVLIIITFDIGMYFIDKNKEKLRTKKEAPFEEQIQPEAIDEDPLEQEDPVKVLIDLSIPADTLLNESQEPGQQNPEKSQLEDFINSAGTEGKKVSVKGKPIVTFDKEINEKPVIEGVDVGITIKVD